ncbi:hypothetical protein GCM10023332_01380 [Luteimonas vadosa]|uniref:Peptidase M12B domain-containing protein n=1 Tax=Luteimonas vadosa TaxID=1165507 RepID=A0ABP9DPA1_9GAMM
MRRIKRSGAYTAYPVALSEAHALNAIRSGELTVPAPDGELIRLRYERHIEHPDGNWTWIGRGSDGADALLTFGEKAVFGSIPHGSSDTLRLTMVAGHSFLVSTDRRKLTGADGEVRRQGTDYFIPPKLADAGEAAPATASQQPGTASAGASASDIVDVLLGYTTGFASQLGGQSQANTRLVNLVDTTNQAYANSGVSMRVRLVHALQVNYPDNTDNASTLEKLTGYKSGSGAVPVDPAFSDLRAARETYGADLVSLVRAFRTPENDGCGIAWLIGGNQSAIRSSDAQFGYSIVGDGSDFDEGDSKTYFCREETLAHELGHNMGQQHNSEVATSTGAHAYSYGYREASTSGFYTVMAYRIKDSSQFSIRHFANPAVNYAGRPTGVANSADNTRSLNITMPIIATFRAGSVPVAPHLHAIAKLGGSGFTEVHVLNGSTQYQSFTQHAATALQQTGNSAAWGFQMGDLNLDGKLDLYTIARQGMSGRTEVHVLDGATGFTSFLRHTATVLGQTGSGNDWMFRVADFNRDGARDLYAINRNGGSGRTDVHILNGATNFQSFLAHSATALHATGSAYDWTFEVADFNRDGRVDLFAIAKLGASGKTEVHILDGASNFQSYLLNRATALHGTPADNSWEFKLGDYNGDLIVDIYAISKQGTSGRTEVHILDGAASYTAFSAHLGTALHQTGANEEWEFELSPGQ